MTCALARIWADSKAQGKCFTKKRYRSSACLHLTSLDTLLSSAATWFNIPKDSNSLIPFPMSCWRKFRRTFRCQDWGVSSHICTNLLWPNGTNKGQPTSTGLPEHRTSIWSRKVGESLDWRFLRERQGNHCHFAACSLHVAVGTLECVASRYKMLQTRLLKTIDMFSQCFMHVAIICHPQGHPCLANV